MKIALLGSNGQLGTDLRRVLTEHDLTAFTRSDFDVTDLNAMREHLFNSPWDAVINTTAFHKVDLCESQPDAAFAVNAIAVYNLARLASQLSTTLVHISTDYVFDGRARKPYSEDSVPAPLNVYATSKLAGEYIVRSTCQKHIVVRTCGLFGVGSAPGRASNFVEAMLRKARAGEMIQVVDDQIVTPTPTSDLAKQLKVILETDQHGLFHCTAEGSCSWYEFARTILELSGLKARLKPTNQHSYESPARRPAYSVLENRRLNRLGLNRMRHWKIGLAEYLSDNHTIATGDRVLQDAESAENDVHTKGSSQ